MDSLSQRLEEAKKIAKKLKEVSKDDNVLGPAEAPLFKKNDIFRFVITILADSDILLEEINNIYPIYQNDKNITVNITRY